jgi:hypothetical protein
MARRIRRKARLRVTGKLSSAEHASLMTNTEYSGEEAFNSPDGYAAAWWQHRDELLAQCRPFTRPCAFWDTELQLPLPGCPSSAYRTEREAILSLARAGKLELTAEEKSLSTKETRDGI